MKKFYYIFGAVAVIGVGAVGWQVSSNVLSTAVAAPIELPEMTNEELGELAQGVALGDEDAPVTIVEFGDYQCPGCGSFALSVKPQVDALLVEQGRAQFVFYDFPLISIHANAFLAARAARCAGEQDAYWAYHTELFRNQTRWAAASMPASAFEQYAEETGLDTDSFDACLNSDKFADVVTANMILAQRAGVTSTPSVFVRGGGVTRRLNSVDFQSLADAVDELSGAPSGGSE